MCASVTKFQKRSGFADADVLIQGYKWGGAPGNGLELTYSFPGGSSVWANGYAQVEQGVSYLTADEKAAMRHILGIIDMYIDLDFKEVADNKKGSGDVRFAKTDIDGAGNVLAEAFTPGVKSPMNGDIWFDIYDPVENFSNSTPTGAMSRTVAMHEVLHALGLKHARENAFGLEKTIMQPGFYKEMFSAGGLKIWSPMQNDIAALQFIYGAGKYNHGNTTYDSDYFRDTFGLVNALGHQKQYVTLWDSGGKDTIALDVFDISLDPNVRNYDSGIFMAHGAVIENFTSTRYYADVTGNAANNKITLGGDIRTDPMYATYNRLGFATTIDTKDGNDTVILARTFYNSMAPSVNNSNVIVDNSFTPNIYLGRGNDKAHGSYFADFLQGSEGNDILYGHEGNDGLDGDAPFIREDGNGGHIYERTGGVDTLYGGAGDDSLEGSMGRDVLYGESGADLFRWSRAEEISTTVDSSIDVIMDFDSGAGDKIKLPLSSGQGTFIGTGAFTGKAYEIALTDNSNDSWTVRVDKDGDADQDWVFLVHTANGEILKAADFSL